MAEPAVVAVVAAVGADDPEIVLGVLIIIFGSNPIAGRCGIARHGQVLLQHLVGVAADADIRAVAVEGL